MKTDGNKPGSGKEDTSTIFVATAKKVLEKSLEDRIVLKESNFENPSKKDVTKGGGTSPGYFANRSSDQHQHILKHAYLSNSSVTQDSDSNDRKALVIEYLLSDLYRATLHDLAPQNALVIQSEDAIANKGIYLRSKFLDNNFQTVGEIIYGKDADKNDLGKLNDIEGMEKVLTSSLLFGEEDYNEWNIGAIQSKNNAGKLTAAKIDHGQSGTVFFSTTNAMRRALLPKLQIHFNFRKENLEINPKAFREAIEEVLNIDESLIEQKIKAKCDDLRKQGMDLEGIKFSYEINGSVHAFEVEPYNKDKHGDDKEAYIRASYDNLANHFKDQILKQREVLKQFHLELRAIENFQPADDKFLKGGWLREIMGQDVIVWAVENGVEIKDNGVAIDPIAWAAKNQMKIEKLDPILWALENSVGIVVDGVEINPIVWAVQNNVVIQDQGRTINPMDLANQRISEFEVKKAVDVTPEEIIEACQLLLIGAKAKDINKILDLAVSNDIEVDDALVKQGVIERRLQPAGQSEEGQPKKDHADLTEISESAEMQFPKAKRSVIEMN